MSKCKINTCYNYTTKVNIYNNPNFSMLPTVRSKIAPPMTVYLPLTTCGKP